MPVSWKISFLYLSKCPKAADCQLLSYSIEITTINSFWIKWQLISSLRKCHCYKRNVKWSERNDMKRISCYDNFPIRWGGSFSCAAANVQDYDIVVSEFEFQWCYYVYFRTNTLGKGMTTFITQLWVKKYHCCPSTRIDQSAVAVEYTDCSSADL